MVEATWLSELVPHRLAMNPSIPPLPTQRLAYAVVYQATCLLFFICAWSGAEAQTSYTSNSATGAWNTSRWNNSSDSSPYTSAYTANQNVSFTSGTYNFAGMGATINVGNITVASGVTVNFTAAANTFATNGAVRTIDVGSGGLIDFAGQSFSTTSGTGFIKNGSGVLALSGNTYNGGFTLNAGTVIIRGVNALGGAATNVLTLNGGTVASNANRSMDNTKYGGGIVIGGNIQFGELSSNVSLASDTANLSFANNVSLGSAVRTLTLGNNGTQTFSGIISNTSGGLIFAANSGTDGRFDITNTANTFTGNITITGGEVRFTADGSMGNAANDIFIDGGRFAKASDATTVTLGAGREIFVGDAAGTSISSPGPGTLVYNGAIADITGKTGTWAKQGGGTLELGGVSSYTGGTAINNGTVKLTTGNDRLPTGTVVSLGQAASSNLGTLDLNGFNQQIAGLNSTTGTNTSSSKNTVTSATAATLTLGGSGTYSYGDGSNANSGVITGAIAVVKSGVGTQTFGDLNTYTGGTTVSGGILRVTNTSGSATGSGNVFVSDSTILGTGIVSPGAGGSITIGSGGKVSVGDTADTTGKVLIFTPASGTISTTFQAGSTLEVDLFSGAGSGDNSSTTAAADIFRWGGSLTIDSGVTLKVNNPNTMTTFNAGDIWRILDWSGIPSGSAPTGTFAMLDLPTLDSLLDWDVSSLYTAGTISIIAVPEPSRAVLLLLGVACFTLRRRR